MSTSSKTKNPSSLEKQCLTIVNTLILKCKLDVPSIRSICDITSDLIVSIFESITNFTILDLLSSTSKVEEAHNVQAVIDTLSLDILGISLCHITGEDIVSGNLWSISNLLEVLHEMLLYSGSTSTEHIRNKPNLKRKICRKRKSSSQTYSRQLRSSCSSGSPVSEVIQRKMIKVSIQPHSVDGMLQEQQKTTPRRASPRLKKVEIGSGKRPESQREDKSSTKSPPSKVRKQIDRNKILLSKQLKNPVQHLEIINVGKKEVAQVTITNNSSWSQKSKPKDLQQKSIAKYPNKTNSVEPNRKSAVKEKTAQNIKGKIAASSIKENALKPTVEKVENLYEKNLERKIRVVIDRNSYLTSRASHLKKWHSPYARKPDRMSTVPPCKKSFLLPYPLRQKPEQPRVLKIKIAGPIPVQIEQTSNEKSDAGKPVSGLIKEINENFPGLELPSSVVSLITKKYQQHLINMHKKARECLLKVPKTKVQAEEAAKKQTAISALLKKDIKYQQHMKEVKENKENSNKLKYHLRNSRMQSVRMKQYRKEFQIEMRKKMLKRNFTEELIYEKVFEDALRIQEEQVDYLCKEVKEAGETDARKQLIYLDALENLYQTQFSMMSEALASQKQETLDEVKAEKEAMDKMHREFQDELKNEIRFMQQAIIECTEDTHFRELDAQECTENLRKRML